jgi:hypothetical protein
MYEKKTKPFKAHFWILLQGLQMFILKNSACFIKSEWLSVLNLDQHIFKK